MSNLKNPSPVTPERTAQRSEDYHASAAMRAMTNALSQTGLDAVCAVPGSTKARNEFSINIPTMKVTNQKSSGRCWIFAGCNVLREIIAKKCNIEVFELSQNYVAFWDKYEKINYFLESILDTLGRPADDRTVAFILSTGIQDGGQWDMFVSVVRKYGVVSKDAMPETYQSENTRELNRVLDMKLRADAAELRRMHGAGKPEAALRARKEAMLDELYAALCMCFTEPPKTFDFEYTDKDKNYHIVRDMTPLRFYEEYAGGALDEYVSVINAPTDDKPFGKTYTVDYLGSVLDGALSDAQHDILYLNLDYSRFEELILAQLKDGEITWFGSDVGKYGNRKACVWDTEGTDYTALGFAPDLSKKDALDYRDSAMNHAMVITGVSLDGDAPVRWKIENSWGDKEAPYAGYYIMSEAWFRRYVYQAVIHKKHLKPEELAALEAEPIHLNPWDPMGALAD